MTHNLLTPSEVAQKLRVTEQSIYRWAQSGAIESVKCGRRVRFTEEQLARFINGGINGGKTKGRQGRSNGA